MLHAPRESYKLLSAQYRHLCVFAYGTGLERPLQAFLKT